MEEVISLAGLWRFETDLQDTGRTGKYYARTLREEGFRLPGSTCENGIGKKQEYSPGFSREAVRAPRERFEYIGPLWLQKEIVLPESMEGKCVTLFLERVNLASELWLDGEPVGRQIIELSAPHVYRLPRGVRPGKHILTLRIDNRNLVNLGDMASGYSIDTQGYWNGVIGRIELRAKPLCHIENIQVYPKETGIRIRLIETCDISSPSGRKKAVTGLWAEAPDGSRLPKQVCPSLLYQSRQVLYFDYEIADIRTWDEFSPALYTLHAEYSDETGVLDEKTVSFGMRTVAVQGKEFLLNGKPLSLRGTINCAQYPLTGYPPMDLPFWKDYFATVKAYGLNHVRFHAWCPPEQAFCAADEAGVYLLVEMPLWLNKDIAALEAGDDPIHRQYFEQEAMTISKTYGNHPSFLLFSNGNETMGDFELLEDLTIRMKACDGRRLYTLTSNFDHPVMPCEDYLSAMSVGGVPARLQQYQDEAAKGTFVDYRRIVESCPVPFVIFEAGQYSTYPDVDLIGRYTGAMLPVNLDAIRTHMKETGVYGRRKEYVRASGELAVRMYKEEIESALRTKGLGGFQLLSLSDYTGQSTALVGILNVFFESKGLIAPEEFCRFCGPVVPLLRAERLLTGQKALEAELDLYDYGMERIGEPVFSLSVYQGERLVFRQEGTQRHVRVPLDGIRRPAMLRAELSVGAYRNSWKLYVFEEEQEDAGLRETAGTAGGAGSPETDGRKTQSGAVTARTPDEVIEVIRRGGRAVVTADCLKDPVGASFLPVFWSPVHFKTRRNCGAIIASSHPVFAEFPTESCPDYQWKEPLDHARGADRRALPEDLEVLVETVPNFADNIPGALLFEATCRGAKLLFCGFDPDAADPASRQLRRSILNYVNSERFNPKRELSVQTWQSIMGIREGTGEK